MAEDWRERIDAAIHAGGDRPSDAYLSAGKRALKRRRQAASGGVLATAVLVVGATLAVGAGTTPRTEPGSFATDTASPSIIPTAEATDVPTTLPSSPSVRPTKVPPTTSAPPTATDTPPPTAPPVRTPPLAPPASQPPATEPPPEPEESNAQVGDFTIVNDPSMDPGSLPMLEDGTLRIPARVVVLRGVDNPMEFNRPARSIAVEYRTAGGKLIWALAGFGGWSTGSFPDGTDGFYAWVEQAAAEVWSEQEAFPVYVQAGQDPIDPQFTEIFEHRRSPRQAAAYGDRSMAHAVHYGFPDGRDYFTLAFASRGTPGGEIKMKVPAHSLPQPTMAAYLDYLDDQAPSGAPPA